MKAKIKDPSKRLDTDVYRGFATVPPRLSLSYLHTSSSCSLPLSSIKKDFAHFSRVSFSQLLVYIFISIFPLLFFCCFLSLSLCTLTRFT